MNTLDEATLRQWPLPVADEASDKEDRGQVLVIAGGREIPGAALLAGTAVLRAGAGKLTVATVQSVAQGLALALPEARVIGLAETALGGPTASSVSQLQACASSAAVVLVGPGLPAGDENDRFVDLLLAGLGTTPVLLDASAMDKLLDGRRFSQPVMVTPHAGEMAHLSGRTKREVLDDAPAAATALAHKHNATVVLKGADTYVATPAGLLWHHCLSNPGLATSGSGDVLAGIIAGIVARGATLEQAAAWGVVVHALAGQRLAERCGPLGFLARELLAGIPRVLRKIARKAA